MRAAIERHVAAGTPITRAQAAWLFDEASDDLLSELATRARDQRHPPGRCTYLKMAIVNTTNVCVARCDYCAFYRLPGQEGAYLLSLEQICRRVDALVALGGTLVGFNGGFHPKLRIHDYARLFAAVRERYPDVELYELTVAEFVYICTVSQVSFDEGARILQEHGTRWITGGGAEILDEAFRQRHSPLKDTVDTFYAAQRAILDAGMGSTATMVIGFDETLEERLNHLERLRAFQDEVGGRLASFLCWTYKSGDTALGGTEIGTAEYLRWLAVCRLYLHNFEHIRTSVLTQNARALEGLRYGADDFDLPTEDEVTQKAGATVSHAFDEVLQAARDAGYTPVYRAPFPIPTGPSAPGASASPAVPSQHVQQTHIP